MTALTRTVPARRRQRSALRDAPFRRYLGGQAMSEIGDQVWYVALSWTAVRLGSPATAGVLMTLASLPRIALMLFGGVIADRFDIRRVMIASDGLRTAITLLAAAIALTGPGLALLVALTLVFGTVDGIFMPAAGAMQPRLLAPEQYTSGAAASNMLARLALSLGAPLGGVMVAVGGLPLALAVDAVTFAISVATLATVAPRPVVVTGDGAADDRDLARPPARPLVTGEGAADDRDPTPPARPLASAYLADFVAGARFLVHEPALGPLTVIGFIASLGFVGPMNIGIAELADHRGWGPTGIGLLLTGFGAGAAASAVALLRWRICRHAGIWTAVLCAASGATIVALGFAPTLTAGLAAAVALGLVSAPFAVTSTVLAQQRTPDDLRGRVSSFNLLSAYGTVPIAIAGTGLGIAAIGLTATFALCGGIQATALFLLCAPGLRTAAIEA